jgi:hypothetical protein
MRAVLLHASKKLPEFLTGRDDKLSRRTVEKNDQKTRSHDYSKNIWIAFYELFTFVEDS